MQPAISTEKNGVRIWLKENSSQIGLLAFLALFPLHRRFV